MRGVALLIVIGGLFLTTADGAELPGMRYETLRQLPDWSGWWFLKIDTAPHGVQLLSSPPPLKPELLPIFRKSLIDVIQNGSTSIDYCRPPEFVGLMNGEGFEDVIELLFTPGRVTLTNERGLIRRIYTDGRVLPADIEGTSTGVSVGKWENGVLVVETRALAPWLKFPMPIGGALRLGAGAYVTERISLVDANTLRIHATLVAPELLTAPLETTTLYSRDRTHLAHPIDACPEGDRLIDPVTRGTRFDLTPPEGLPPPPEG